MNKPTYIDGIASSQTIDSSGEIVDLKGLDTSSLIGGAMNFEHESKLPSQIVGKVLEAHKIFSEEDCQNVRHKYFWDKFKIPFLYCMGRLFDDKKDSSKEVAALLKDDQEHPQESDMIGFSIEGSKIEKVGAMITRSIARKLTLTHLPCNKTCIAEVLPEKKDKNDIDSLFKGEMELFQFEPTYIEIMEKKEELNKAGGMGATSAVGTGTAAGSSVGSAGTSAINGGTIIGSTIGSSFGTKKKKNPLDIISTVSSIGGFGKSLEAGSAMAAPSQLVGGAALGKESLDKPKKMYKKEKSQLYERADQAYSTWDKKNHFKTYMKKRMPHLAEGEVDAIGRVLALRKTMQAEKKLSKMYASYFVKSEDYIHGVPKGHPSLGEHKGHMYRRIAPPTAQSNHWSWAVRSPEGKDSKAHLPHDTAGSKESIHAHIDSMIPKVK